MLKGGKGGEGGGIDGLEGDKKIIAPGMVVMVFGGCTWNTNDNSDQVQLLCFGDAESFVSTVVSEAWF